VTAGIGRSGQPIYLCECGLDGYMVKSSNTNIAWIFTNDGREPKTTQQKSSQNTAQCN